MPRNYDEMAKAEDREFVIRGETFQITRGSPELVGRIEEMQKEFAESEVTDIGEVIAFADARLVALLDGNGSVERWKKLREQEDVSYGEIMDVSKWAYETITGLPTTPPAPSPAGPGSTGASSKAG